MAVATTPAFVTEARGRIILTLLVVVCYGLFIWQPDWLGLLGVTHLGRWFVDTRAVLAASDAHVLGLDPSDPNPLDLFRQTHVYSYWWFGLDSFGLTRSDYVWLGALLGTIFLVVALFQVRMRTTGELLWSAAALTAPSIMLGFDRGNADLFVFIVISAAVPCLLSPHAAFRWISVAVILFATGLKFYPAVAGLVLLAPTRSRREILFQAASFAALLAVVAVNVAPDIQRYFTDTARPKGFFTFGTGLHAHLLSVPIWMVHVTAVAIGIGAIVFWWRLVPTVAVPKEQQPDHLKFVLGAILLTACYFVTINYAYRRVFTILMLPFLWSTAHADYWPVWFRRVGRVTSVLLLVLLWLDGLICLTINLSQQLTQAEIRIWTNWLMLAEQPLNAVLTLALLGFLVAFVRDALNSLRLPDDRNAITAT